MQHNIKQSIVRPNTEQYSKTAVNIHQIQQIIGSGIIKRDDKEFTSVSYDIRKIQIIGSRSTDKNFIQNLSSAQKTVLQALVEKGNINPNDICIRADINPKTIQIGSKYAIQDEPIIIEYKQDNQELAIITRGGNISVNSTVNTELHNIFPSYNISEDYEQAIEKLLNIGIQLEHIMVSATDPEYSQLTLSLYGNGELGYITSNGGIIITSKFQKTDVNFEDISNDDLTRHINEYLQAKHAPNLDELTARYAIGSIIDYKLNV